MKVRLLLANEKGGTTLLSLVQLHDFVTNAPNVTVAPDAPRVCKEKKKYSFFSFFLMRGRCEMLDLHQLHQMLQLHQMHQKYTSYFIIQFCSLNGFAAKLQI